MFGTELRGWILMLPGRSRPFFPHVAFLSASASNVRGTPGRLGLLH